MWLRALLLPTLLPLLSCTRSPTQTDPIEDQAAPAHETAPISNQTAPSPCAGDRHTTGTLHWFEDDYPRALACARAKDVPLVIDMWAPWCHTCLSMQAYVLSDERLADFDRTHVFVALDTDRPGNAEIVGKFPPVAWPTFFVLSPRDESIHSTLVGAGTVEQVAAFLEDGRTSFVATMGATSGTDLPAWQRAAQQGDRAVAQGNWDGAYEHYGQALATPPPDWARGPEVRLALLVAAIRATGTKDCVEVVTSNITHMGTAASASDFGYRALQCADKQTDPATAQRLRETVVTHLQHLVDRPDAALSVDDRSDALMYLRRALDALQRAPEARAAAQQQRQLLDQAAHSATSPYLAMTYNGPRAEVYAYLGIPDELVPELERNAGALPDQYDPPYRLAMVLLAAKKPQQALPWAQRAVAQVYGPRKDRALNVLADVYAALGDQPHEQEIRAQLAKPAP